MPKCSYPADLSSAPGHETASYADTIKGGPVINCKFALEFYNTLLCTEK